MSQENVEIVRSGLEAAARNDGDAAMASVDPNVAWEEMPSLGSDASSYTGIEELREAVNSWIAMWSDYEAEFARAVFTLREGKVVRVRLYGSWAEALEAAGLRE